MKIDCGMEFQHSLIRPNSQEKSLKSLLLLRNPDNIRCPGHPRVLVWKSWDIDWKGYVFPEPFVTASPGQQVVRATFVVKMS